MSAGPQHSAALRAGDRVRPHAMHSLVPEQQVAADTARARTCRGDCLRQVFSYRARPCSIQCIKVGQYVALGDSPIRSRAHHLRQEAPQGGTSEVEAGKGRTREGRAAGELGLGSRTQGA
jgi:hypothetical protein